MKVVIDQLVALRFGFLPIRGFLWVFTSLIIVQVFGKCYTGFSVYNQIRYTGLNLITHKPLLVESVKSFTVNNSQHYTSLIDLLEVTACNKFSTPCMALSIHLEHGIPELPILIWVCWFLLYTSVFGHCLS